MTPQSRNENFYKFKIGKFDCISVSDGTYDYVSAHFFTGMSDDEVNLLAYESEKIVHGTPSGIDNNMATFGKFILYRKGSPPLLKDVKTKKPIPIVIGFSGIEGITLQMVRKVRKAWEKDKRL